jgi:hypothetical protein
MSKLQPEVVDRVVAAVLAAHDGSELWDHAKRDPDAFRRAVAGAIGTDDNLTIQPADKANEPPPLTRASLSRQVASVHHGHDCTHEHPLEFVQKCHPDGALQVSYHDGDGVLEIVCSMCLGLVAKVQVAP